MGCDLRLPVQYIQTLPTLASKLLGIQNDKDVLKLLKQFETDTTNLLKRSLMPDEKDKVIDSYVKDLR
jgi:hypothetical protein